MEQGAWLQLLVDLSRYIEEHYEGKRISAIPQTIVGRDTAVPTEPCAPCPSMIPETDDVDCFCDIHDIFSKQKRPLQQADSNISEVLESFENIETFSEALLRIIKEKDLIEADVYNRVFMDRKLFNKIRNDRTYQPSKRTAILLAVALRLSVTETQEFLGKAGFSLTHTSKTDIIIEFFMMRGNYNVMEINAALYEHRLAPLNK